MVHEYLSTPTITEILEEQPARTQVVYPKRKYNYGMPHRGNRHFARLDPRSPYYYKNQGYRD